MDVQNQQEIVPSSSTDNSLIIYSRAEELEQEVMDARAAPARA